jgi:class 3 adenylate cyclase
MARSSAPSGAKRFTERKLVMLVVDLAGSTRLVARFDSVELAELINTFYAMCGAAVKEHGGRIVKFIGDGCLAVFPESEGVAAIDASIEINQRLDVIRKDWKIDAEIGVNVHQSVVAEGDFEPDGQYDITGTGVFYTFRMGGGPGMRISEPIYRQLPNDRRGPWEKHRPPATYTLGFDEPR